MKKSEWSDYELEELLRQMPKIEDLRHPCDIYQNPPLKKRKSRILFPGIATAAVFVPLLILGPRLMSGPQYWTDKADKAKYSVDKEMSLSENNKDSTKASKQDSSLKTKENSNPKKSKLLVMLLKRMFHLIVK